MKFFLILAIAVLTINGQKLPKPSLTGIVSGITGILSSGYNTTIVNKT